MNMLLNYVAHISNSVMLSSLLIFMIIFGPLFVLMIALAIQEQMNARKEKDVLTEEWSKLERKEEKIWILCGRKLFKKYCWCLPGRYVCMTKFLMASFFTCILVRIQVNYTVTDLPNFFFIIMRKQHFQEWYESAVFAYIPVDRLAIQSKHIFLFRKIIFIDFKYIMDVAMKEEHYRKGKWYMETAVYQKS